MAHPYDQQTAARFKSKTQIGLKAWGYSYSFLEKRRVSPTIMQNENRERGSRHQVVIQPPQENTCRKKRRTEDIQFQYRQHYRTTSSYSSKDERALLKDVFESDEAYEQQQEYLRNLKVSGYLIIIITWILFVFSIGTIFNLWHWCFNFNPQYMRKLKSVPWLKVLIEDISQQNDSAAVPNYYLYLFFLSFVILWIWAVASWISMKLFRHSKGGGS